MQRGWLLKRGLQQGYKQRRDTRERVQWPPGTNDGLGAGTPLPEVEHINLLTSQVSQVATTAQSPWADTVDSSCPILCSPLAGAGQGGNHWRGPARLCWAPSLGPLATNITASVVASLVLQHKSSAFVCA